MSNDTEYLEECVRDLRKEISTLREVLSAALGKLKMKCPLDHKPRNSTMVRDCEWCSKSVKPDPAYLKELHKRAKIYFKNEEAKQKKRVK